MTRIGMATVLGLAVLLTGCSRDQGPGEAVSGAPVSEASVSEGPDSEDTVWPGEDWLVSTPEAEGLEAAPIDRFVADLRSGAYGLVDHLLLIRHGRVVVDERFERDYESVAASLRPEDKIGINARDPQFDYDNTNFHPYYNGTDLHSLQSVSKSVTSAALGIAVDAGLIEGVDVPVLPFFEAYDFDRSDPRRSAITLQDLLTMRSGIAWVTEGGFQGATETHSTVGLENSDAWIQFVLDRPMDAEPGTVFEYNDGVSVLLGKIVREATGKRVDQWAEERLFAPIGIDRYFWKITPDGEADTEGGLYLSAHDLARIGYLFLRQGRWRDERILSEEWIRESVTPHVADTRFGGGNMGYGYQWWLPGHGTDAPMAYQAAGFGGQRLTVIPAYDLVAVFHGWDIRGRYGRAESAFRREVLPAAVREPTP